MHPTGISVYNMRWLQGRKREIKFMLSERNAGEKEVWLADKLQSVSVLHRVYSWVHSPSQTWMKFLIALRCFNFQRSFFHYLHCSKIFLRFQRQSRFSYFISPSISLIKNSSRFSFLVRFHIFLWVWHFKASYKSLAELLIKVARTAI